jgi:glyoxylase-like metal-dependent hydrolase (beta-lactamase superfamily II)
VLAAVLRPDVPSYAFANSLVVVGDESVLVVDTQQDPAAARFLLDVVRSRTRLPVRWVVNTHQHADHVWGNEVYRAAFPGVPIVAHRTTRALLLEHGRAEIEKQKTSVRESIAVRREWLARGAGPEGAPLTDADRESLRRSLEVRAAYLGELDTLQLIVPNVTFDDAMSVDLGGRSVELIHVGPAHTAGDIVAYLPESGVLAAGDVVEEGRLWLEGADVRGWARALSRLRRLDVSALLPGHGAISRGHVLLDVEGGFLDAVVAWADREGGTGDPAGSVNRREPCSSEAPIPRPVSDYADAFSAWGVEPEAFRELALKACRGALPSS